MTIRKQTCEKCKHYAKNVHFLSNGRAQDMEDACLLYTTKLWAEILRGTDENNFYFTKNEIQFTDEIAIIYYVDERGYTVQELLYYRNTDKWTPKDCIYRFERELISE